MWVQGERCPSLALGEALYLSGLIAIRDQLVGLCSKAALHSALLSLRRLH